MSESSNAVKHELNTNSIDRQRNSFASTRVSGNARAILGNVYNNYFVSAKKTDKQIEAANNGPLTVFSGENAIDPDLISDYDAARAHLVRREQRLKGSCEWLFATKEYKQWNGGRSSPLLVCAGPVGCGKSIIASAVIDRLEEVAVESTTITYYVDANVNKPTTAVDIIRAFVKQLVLSRQSSRSPIQSDLRKTIDATFAELRRPPSLISTTQILLGVIRDAPVSVVVDGLDAMDEHEILSFLQFLRDLIECTKISGSRLRLALFCRETLGRNISLEVVPGTTVLRIDVVHLRQDIYAYIGHEVEH